MYCLSQIPPLEIYLEEIIMDVYKYLSTIVVNKNTNNGELAKLFMVYYKMKYSMGTENIMVF